MKFLRQLFGRGSNTNLFMAAANGELCQVLPAQNIGNTAQLQVAAGQNALLFNGDRRSAIFPAGEHLLEAQDIRYVLDGGQANILFLQIAPPVKRVWQLALRPEGSEEALVLSGYYTAAIDDTRLFTTALLKSGKLPDSRQVDNWLHHHIRKIFAEQHIPAADIREHTDKLSVFLHDALIPYLLDCGIRLQNFSLQLQEESAPAAAQASSVAAQEPVIPALVPHKQEEIPSATHSQPESAHAIAVDDADEEDILIATPQRPAAKIFYRLEKGEQVGPYSVDEINAFIQEGKIRPHDLLWHQGMRSWQRAADFSTLNW